MGRITVHTHGKARQSAYSELLNTYADRLAGRGVKLVEHSGRLDHDSYVEKLTSMASDSILIMLDENGPSGSTEWFCQRWNEWRISTTNVHLAIGPVDGFSTKAIETANSSLSLGPLTMTYEMAAVVLMEQLYRASEIERGSAYHRA